MSERTLAALAAHPSTATAKDRMYTLSFKDEHDFLVANGDSPQEGYTNLVVTEPANLTDVPMPVLLAVVNKVLTTPVHKFGNIGAATKSTFTAMQRLANPKPSAEKAPKAPKEKGPRQPTLYSRTPRAASKIVAVRAGSKAALLVDLLARPEGVTIPVAVAELSKWGAAVPDPKKRMGFDVADRLGYGIRSEVENGEVVYRLAYPDGMTAPLAHLPSRMQERAAKAEQSATAKAQRAEARAKAREAKPAKAPREPKPSKAEKQAAAKAQREQQAAARKAKQNEAAAAKAVAREAKKADKKAPAKKVPVKKPAPKKAPAKKTRAHARA